MKIEHREKLAVSTKSVHAATVEIWNGHPVFAWFGGTKEGDQDTGIYLRNLKGKNETIVLGADDLVPRWNPILVNVGSDLLLFEKAGFFCDRWQTFIHNVSKWNLDITPKETPNMEILPAGLNGPVKSRPIINGNRMYCGSSFETLYDWTSYIEEYIIDGSSVKFDSRSKPLTAPTKNRYFNPRSGRNEKTLGLIQPSLCELNGNMFAFMRSSKGLERIYYTDRKTGADGLTYWTDPIQTNLPNPNSAVDVVSYNDSIYLIWNPDAYNRFPLILSKIHLEGIVNSEMQIEIEDSIVISDEINDENFIEKGCISPELSYPYMIENDGSLHIVYTRGRNLIEYCIVKL